MGSCCIKSDEEEPNFTKPLVKETPEQSRPVSQAKLVSPVQLNDFNIEKVLGKGAFGKVFLVTKRDSGHLYAMKSLRKDMIEQRNQKVHTQTEREILGDVKSPFIVQLRFAFQTPDKL